MLRAVATDRPISETLDLICDEIAETFPGSTPAILIVDVGADGLTLATPNRVPPAVAEFLDRMPIARTTVASGHGPTSATDLSPESEVWQRLGPRPQTDYVSVWSTALDDTLEGPIGVLMTFWATTATLTDTAAQALDTLADITVSALLRHRRQQHSLSLVARERDRIAGELHDDSVQAMTAVSLRLQRLRSRLADEEQRDLATAVLESADGAIIRLRAMLFELHPSTLADDGLIETFSIFMEDHAAATDIKWHVTGNAAERAPLQVEALAFRLGQEAINNALKHAGATQIDICVERLDVALHLTVTDNGAGFDSNHAVQQAGHLGLTHASSLAASGGGTHKVDSTIGHGTTVRVSLPTILTK